MKIGPVEYLIGAFGTGLLVAAIANRNPLDVVREAINLDPNREVTVRALRTPTPYFSGDRGTPDTNDATDAANAFEDRVNLGNPSGTPQLEVIGGPQGNHRLTPAAVAAFRRWQAAYGQTIYITDSYRSYEVQAAAHARDPKRFASADGSAHVDGLAVDVDLGRTCNGQSRKGQPMYDRLMSTGAATGWQTYSGGDPAKGDVWHFSYGTRR